MKTIIIALSLLSSTFAWASEDTSSKRKPQSRAQMIREHGMNCGLAEIDAYERVRGRLPTDDEMDAIIDACVNPTFKKQS